MQRDAARPGIAMKGLEITRIEYVTHQSMGAGIRPPFGSGVARSCTITVRSLSRTLTRGGSPTELASDDAARRNPFTQRSHKK